MIDPFTNYLFLPPEDDPPEYDVADRVRQLNEELAKEPTPSSDERRRSIKFKETLVDLVAPPYDYSDDDDDDSRENGNTNANSQGDDGGDGGGEGGDRDARNDSEKILVEHGGKFELINRSDLTSEEKQLYGLEESGDDVDAAGHSGGRAGRLKQPRPPDMQRPVTANGSMSRQPLNVTGPAPHRRPQTAQPRTNNDMLFNFSYVSPYGLSPEQKKCLQRQKQLQEKHMTEKQRMEREKKEWKQQENESAFQAWLTQKREVERRGQNEAKKGTTSSENGVRNTFVMHLLISLEYQLITCVFCVKNTPFSSCPDVLELSHAKQVGTSCDLLLRLCTAFR